MQYIRESWRQYREGIAATLQEREARYGFAGMMFTIALGILVQGLISIGSNLLTPVVQRMLSGSSSGSDTSQLPEMGFWEWWAIAMVFFTVLIVAGVIRASRRIGVLRATQGEQLVASEVTSNATTTDNNATAGSSATEPADYAETAPSAGSRLSSVAISLIALVISCTTIAIGTQKELRPNGVDIQANLPGERFGNRYVRAIEQYDYIDDKKGMLVEFGVHDNELLNLRAAVRLKEGGLPITETFKAAFFANSGLSRPPPQSEALGAENPEFREQGDGWYFFSSPYMGLRPKRSFYFFFESSSQVEIIDCSIMTMQETQGYTCGKPPPVEKIIREGW